MHLHTVYDFFLKIAFTIQGVLCFHTKCEIFCSSSVKNEHGNLRGTALNLLEKTLESPLDCKEIQPVHSEGDQPWDFFGRKDAKAETPVLWPPHEKS